MLHKIGTRDLNNILVKSHFTTFLYIPQKATFREKSFKLNYLEPSRRKSDSVRLAKRLPQPFLHKV